MIMKLGIQIKGDYRIMHNIYFFASGQRSGHRY